MAITAVPPSAPAPVYRVPITSAAKQSDELSESPSTRARESQTGNEAAALVQTPVAPPSNPNVGQTVNTTA